MSGANRRNQRVLLLSTSKIYGSGYLDYAEAEIRDFLTPEACPVHSLCALRPGRLRGARSTAFQGHGSRS